MPYWLAKLTCYLQHRWYTEPWLIVLEVFACAPGECCELVLFRQLSRRVEGWGVIHGQAMLIVMAVAMDIMLHQSRSNQCVVGCVDQPFACGYMATVQ